MHSAVNQIICLCKNCAQRVHEAGQKAVGVYTHLPHFSVDRRSEKAAWWENPQSFTNLSSRKPAGFPTLHLAGSPLENHRLSTFPTEPITTTTIYKLIRRSA